MVKRANRVQETATTTGTGTLTLAGAVSKYRAFSASFAVGNSIYYSIEDVTTTDWEVGAGTLLSATTLSRDQVFSSSNAGALVAFTAGTRNVWCTDPAENQWPVVKNSTAAVEVCTVPVASQMIVMNTFDNRGTLEVLEHLEILDSEVAVTANLIQNSSLLVSGTAIATTAGTSIDFTGIPSWAKRITLMLNGVSTTGAINYLVQLGSGAVESAGYVSQAYNRGGEANATNGFLITSSLVAASILGGSITFVAMGANLWVSTGILIGGGAIGNQCGGYKTFAGVIDRLRLTTATGVDTFDAGSINILIE